MPWLSEQLGEPGLYESLAALDDDPRGAIEVADYCTMMETLGIPNAPPLVRELEGLGLLTRIGTTVGLSTSGAKTTLLLRALNGDDLQNVFRRIRRMDSALANYSLVREGMTTGFFKSLARQPDIGALYICSPWINMTELEQRYLTTGVIGQQRRGGDLDILVITRPDDGYGTRTENLKPFIDLGATVFVQQKLHSKLYIREPGLRGGYISAIVGSENLTRSKYIEVGIRIEADSVIIRKLIAYFFDISHHSQEIT